MKCSKCGKEQLEKAVTCLACGQRFSKEVAATPDRSTLIEFPAATPKRNSNAAANNSATSAGNNDWRAELSEKVRQVRERRTVQEARGRLQAELEAAAQRYQQTNSPAPANASNVKNLTGTPSSSDNEERSPNPIIEAALKRAKRASEAAVKKQFANMTTATAPKMATQAAPQLASPMPASLKPIAMPSALTEVAPVTNPQSMHSLALDIQPNEEVIPFYKMAAAVETENESEIDTGETELADFANAAPIIELPARNFAAEMEVRNTNEPVNEFIPETEEVDGENIDDAFDGLLAPSTSPAPNAFTSNGFTPSTYIPSEFVPSHVVDEVAFKEPAPIEDRQEKPVRVIKESEAGTNYLDDLISVCNKNLTIDNANASQRFIAIFIDLTVILLASGLFWLSTFMMGVGVSEHHIFQLLIALTIAIGIIYLTVTVTLVSRTFGMMFVGTHVINNNNGAHPSIFQAALRGVGYMLCIALLGLGFGWIIFDREKRGLHDIVSGTLVVRDY